MVEFQKQWQWKDILSGGKMWLEAQSGEQSILSNVEPILFANHVDCINKVVEYEARWIFWGQIKEALEGQA